MKANLNILYEENANFAAQPGPYVELRRWCSKAGESDLILEYGEIEINPNNYAVRTNKVFEVIPDNFTESTSANSDYIRMAIKKMDELKKKYNGDVVYHQPEPGVFHVVER